MEAKPVGLFRGPAFAFSDAWRQIINTATKVIAFLLAFLIQYAQAIHLKLDEIIRAMDAADNRIIETENPTDTELERLADRYARLAAATRERRRRPGLNRDDHDNGNESGGG